MAVTTGRRPAVTVLSAAVGLTLLYTGHLIRQDLHRGQPCSAGGDRYLFRTPIGSYECSRG